MKSKLKIALLAAVSCVSGLINALIGAGGGVILALTLPSLLSGISPQRNAASTHSQNSDPHRVDSQRADSQRAPFPDRRDIYINAQAAMIPGCALSCAVYALRGMLDTAGFSLLAIPAAAGGALGSLLLSKINNSLLQIIFAALVIWSGIRMLFG